MKPTLMSIRAEYVQSPDGDDCTPGYPDQTLTLEMTHCGAGPFLVIETERWAFDRPKELHRLVQSFAQVATLFDQEPNP